MREVYLINDGEAIKVLDLETDEVLYQFSYRHNGVLIWNEEDAWRQLRKNHLPHDLYKEVYKCGCDRILRIPDRVEARCNETNKIEIDLFCECGNVITIECDTLRFKGVK